MDGSGSVVEPNDQLNMNEVSESDIKPNESETVNQNENVTAEYNYNRVKRKRNSVKECTKRRRLVKVDNQTPKYSR